MSEEGRKKQSCAEKQKEALEKFRNKENVEREGIAIFTWLSRVFEN